MLRAGLTETVKQASYIIRQLSSENPNFWQFLDNGSYLRVTDTVQRLLLRQYYCARAFCNLTRVEAANMIR
jgi:hypothetical protein